MARERFWFVAGEQAMGVVSISVLDAWLGIECKARSEPIASEFRTLPIEAFDSSGASLGAKTWRGWHEAVLRDTYGSRWHEHLEEAEALIR